MMPDILQQINSIMGDEVLYQNYLRPPLDQLPAQVTSTQLKLDIVKPYCEGKVVLDYGCANGALDIELGAETVFALDTNSKYLAVVDCVAHYCNVRVIPCNSIEGWVNIDTVLFLSVWKHIRYHHGMEYANQVLASFNCDTLLFDAGLSGAPTDLGSPIGPNDVPDLIRSNTKFTQIELAGTYIDNLNIKREIWKAQ